MKKQKTRWLPITVKKRIIGMLTMNDILRIEPGLFEIVRENMSIKESDEKLRRKAEVLSGKESWTEEGECERCEAFDLLYNIEGELICEECTDSINRLENIK